MINSNTLNEILELAANSNINALTEEIDILSKEEFDELLKTFVQNYFDMVDHSNLNEDEVKSKQFEVIDYFQTKDANIIAQWMCGEYIEGAPELE